MSDLLVERLKEVVHALHEKTLSGRLEWKKGFEENSFETRLGKFSIRISEQWDDESQERYEEITLRNQTGDEIEKFVPGQLGMASNVYGGGQPYWKLFGEIYVRARRQALGVDKAVEDLLSELRKS